jgi:hypothetical protein
MWNDPIVEEVRTARDKHARKFNYNLKAIAADLKKQQKAGGRKVVSLPAKKTVILPKTKVGREN